MKTIENPKNGARIRGFVHAKRSYDLPVDTSLPFEDSVAVQLLKTFKFLHEKVLEGKYVCKHGDYANDVKIAVLNHEKGHKGAPVVEQGREYTTPQEQLDDERAARFEDRQIAEDNAAGLEGPGLEVDNEGAFASSERAGRF